MFFCFRPTFKLAFWGISNTKAKRCKTKLLFCLSNYCLCQTKTGATFLLKRWMSFLEAASATTRCKDWLESRIQSWGWEPEYPESLKKKLNLKLIVHEELRKNNFFGRHSDLNAGYSLSNLYPLLFHLGAHHVWLLPSFVSIHL